jgi:type II secretion system protein N
MKISNKTVLYTIYIIAITGFFLYYLFPSDTLKSYLAYRLSQASPDTEVIIDRVSPAIPPGISLHNVGIAHRNEPLVDLDNIQLMPGILSLFSEKTTVNFKGHLNGGTFKGQAHISDNPGGPEVTGEGQISGIQVQGIPALDRLPADEISGMLNGKFTFVTTGPNQTAEGQLTLSQSRIVLNKAVFNLRALEFRDINADLILENNTLTIKQTSARGNQLDADLSGTIALSGKKALDLNVSVKPHHLLLAKIEKTLPLDLLRQKNAGDSAISFTIDGTFDQPGFSLN